MPKSIHFTTFYVLWADGATIMMWLVETCGKLMWHGNMHILKASMVFPMMFELLITIDWSIFVTYNPIGTDEQQ